jgi:hypothetical protein
MYPGPRQPRQVHGRFLAPWLGSAAVNRIRPGSAGCARSGSGGPGQGSRCRSSPMLPCPPSRGLGSHTAVPGDAAAMTVQYPAEDTDSCRVRSPMATVIVFAARLMSRPTQCETRPSVGISSCCHRPSISRRNTMSAGGPAGGHGCYVQPVVVRVRDDRAAGCCASTASWLGAAMLPSGSGSVTVCSLARLAVVGDQASAGRRRDGVLGGQGREEGGDAIRRADLSR